MSTADPGPCSHAADVRIGLHLPDRVFTVGQLGPDFVILDEPAESPPGVAEIAVAIDGHRRRWPVHLPDGVTPGKPETRIARYQPAGNGSTVG